MEPHKTLRGGFKLLEEFATTEKINNGGYVIPNDTQFEMITLCRNRSKKSKKRS